MRISPWIVVVVMLASVGPVSAQSLRVSVDRTSLRDRPATDGAIVVAVEKGAELQVLERWGAWYRVRVNGTGAEGFVHNLMVESTGAVTAPPAMPAAPAPPPPSASTPAPAAMAAQAPAVSASGPGFALKGGITQASFFGADVSGELGQLTRRTGFTVGAALSVPMGTALSIQPEVLLTEKGARPAEDEDEASNLRYLEIPLLIKFKFGQSSSAPFVYAGPAFSLLMSATFTDAQSGESEDISDEVKGTDLGLVVGGGVAFGRFTAEARLTRGLSTIDAVPEGSSADPADVKNTALSVLFGISFGGR